MIPARLDERYSGWATLRSGEMVRAPMIEGLRCTSPNRMGRPQAGPMGCSLPGGRIPQCSGATDTTHRVGLLRTFALSKRSRLTRSYLNSRTAVDRSRSESQSVLRRSWWHRAAAGRQRATTRPPGRSSPKRRRPARPTSRRSSPAAGRRTSCRFSGRAWRDNVGGWLRVPGSRRFCLCRCRVRSTSRPDGGAGVSPERP
jgi:hypothetical protein